MVFDSLIRPAPELSTEERVEVKKVARQLLERLKELLVPTQLISRNRNVRLSSNISMRAIRRGTQTSMPFDRAEDTDETTVLSGANADAATVTEGRGLRHVRPL